MLKEKKEQVLKMKNKEEESRSVTDPSDLEKFWDGVLHDFDEAYIDSLIKERNKYKSLMRWLSILVIVEALVIIFR